MHYFISILIFALAAVGFGCGSGDSKPATPLETYQTYTKAIKAKDTTAMKLLLSSETLKMHEQEAKSQNTTVDEIVKRQTLFNENQTRVEYRNEKIDGQTSTIEVKNSFDMWEVVPFVFEDKQWKIDKKGYADRLTREIEEDMRKADERINSGRMATDDPLQQPIDTNSNTNTQPF